MSTNLILTMTLLMAVLLILVSLYIALLKKRSPKKMPYTETVTFETLCRVIDNPASTTENLRNATDDIVTRFPEITEGNVQQYVQLVETLCTHPATDSRIILDFEKLLRKKNPNFANRINQALTAGLKQRG